MVMNRISFYLLTISLLITIPTLASCTSGGIQIAASAPPATATTQLGVLPENYQFSMVWSDSDENKGTMDFWVKGDQRRTDWRMTQDGINKELLIIDDGQFGYIYYPDDNLLKKYKSASMIINPGAIYVQEFEDRYYGGVPEAEILAALQAAYPFGANIARHEIINGQPSTKFTGNISSMCNMNYYWITPNGWLARAEITQGDDTYTAEFTDIDLSTNISDDLFDIDKVAPEAEIMDHTGT
jgi:outer membrane lipoprotein-sorting protein